MVYHCIAARLLDGISPRWYRVSEMDDYEQNPDDGGGGALLALGLAIGLLILLSRRSQAAVQLALPDLSPTQPLPAGVYSNEEKWDIEWNKDGLPISVTVHRQALRS